jgi:hypothetical protein
VHKAFCSLSPSGHIYAVIVAQRFVTSDFLNGSPAATKYGDVSAAVVSPSNQVGLQFF